MRFSTTTINRIRHFLICFVLTHACSSALAQTTGCADTLKSTTITSPFFNPAQQFYATPAADNGTLIFQNLPTVPKGIVLLKVGAHTQPVWLKKINQNASSRWNKIQELDDQTILISTPYFPGAGNNLVVDKLLFDPSGDFRYCLGYSNQPGDSGMQVVNSGNPGTLITAGNRTAANGNGIVAESFSYAEDEENWNHNILASELANRRIQIGQIWKRNTRIYIAGTFTRTDQTTSGIWTLVLDNSTGAIIGYSSYELHHQTAAMDSLIATGLTEIRNLPNGDIYFLFGVITNGYNHPTLFIRCDSSGNISGNPVQIQIPGQAGDFTTAGINANGSWFYSARQPGSRFASFWFGGAAGPVRAQLYEYGLEVDVNTIQLHFSDNSQLKTVNPVSQASQLSFQIFTTSPYLSGGQTNCVYITDASEITQQTMVAVPSPINWYSSGFDTAPITSVTILSNTEPPFSSEVFCEMPTHCDSLIIKGPTAVCQNDSLYAFAALRNPDCHNPLTWSTNNDISEVITGASDSTVKLKIKRAGLSYIKASMAGCGLTDSVAVHINSPKQVSLGNDTILCEKNSLLLSADGFQEYQWQDGSTQPSYLVQQTGEYTLRAIDKCGIGSSDIIRIEFKPCTNRFQMPSAFTPNGDGKNDVIKPTIEGNLISYDLSIYNRWGQLVFHSRNPGVAWDGNIRNAIQQTGSYVWFCDYQFAGESAIRARGTLLLIK